MTTIEILKNARELLSDPAHWMKQGSNALHVEDATSFCTWHAICRVATVGAAYKARHSILSALGFVFFSQLFDWNDAPERTHAEVLQRFDEAIARLEAAG